MDNWFVNLLKPLRSFFMISPKIILFLCCLIYLLILPHQATFAQESIEARVSDATTQFGLAFLNNLSNDTDSNVVISPLSIQSLLNMVLLGATDGSATQLELCKVLNYGTTNLFSNNSERLKPHEAMHNVFQSILDVTHMSLPPSGPVAELDLLNTNSASLPKQIPVIDQKQPQKLETVAAHLQTSVRESEDPLSGQVNFTLANLVLTDRDQVDINTDYEKELKQYYNVNVEQFSQKTKGNKTIQEVPLHERINKWIKNNTQNQIEKLVDEGDLDGVMLVLLNAAHFKGRWLRTFNPKATVEKNFLNNGKNDDVTEVKFMRQKDVFGYADFSTTSLQNEFGLISDSKILTSEDAETLLTKDEGSSGAPTDGKSKNDSLSDNKDPPITAASIPVIELSKEETRRMELTAKLNCTVLILPFSLNDGQELSMAIFLPSKPDGVGKLQASLDAATLNEIYKSVSEQQVQVEIPKFSFDGSYNAKEVLINMGLSTVFNSKANLGRMVKNKQGQASEVQVDKVIHKAKINVDEMGAEAAAASVATVVLRNFIRPPTPIFVANHPFLFVIRHNRSNMPIFMGRVSKF